MGAKQIINLNKSSSEGPIIRNILEAQGDKGRKIMDELSNTVEGQ